MLIEFDNSKKQKAYLFLSPSGDIKDHAILEDFFTFELLNVIVSIFGCYVQVLYPLKCESNNIVHF